MTHTISARGAETRHWQCCFSIYKTASSGSKKSISSEARERFSLRKGSWDLTLGYLLLACQQMPLLPWRLLSSITDVFKFLSILHVRFASTGRSSQCKSHW